MTDRIANYDTLDDFTPAIFPSARRLSGNHVTLEKLEADRVAGEIYAVTHGDSLRDSVWEYLPTGPFPNRRALHDFLSACADDRRSAFFVIRDVADHSVLGFIAFLEIDTENASIEIGFVTFSPELQRTVAATEVQFLLMRYALDELGYRRLFWKCNAMNKPSYEAALRLGYRYEGTFFQHMVVKGRNRDTAWFSILDSEWPPLRGCFERWLEPANFDASGQQKTSLRELIGRVNR